MTAEYPSSIAGGRPFGRWATVATAGAVIAYGISRRSMGGMVIAAAAVPFAYRGLRDQFGDGNDTRTALSGEGGIRVKESVRLECSAADVYRFWRDLITCRAS